MATRLSEIALKRKKLVVGLSSGTSADGVDAVLAQIEGSGLETKARILAHTTYPYPPPVKEAVILLSDGRGSVEEVCRMNYLLGDFFADACLMLVASSGFRITDVDVIGSHGQTVCHISSSASREKGGPLSTLQLGEASVIAERTGAVVVYDFRSADVAGGGEGAPLAPCVDYILFRDPGVSRGFLNIGGIANLTVLPADCTPDRVIGFDTGPGNMVLDYLAKTYFATQCDKDGTLSSRGRPSEDIVKKLLQLDYFIRQPPKSTGRELFGSRFAEDLVRMGKDRKLSKEDIIATASRLTSRSVHKAYTDFVAGTAQIDELYVSGGGMKNNTLMLQLESLFSPIPIYTTDKLGIPPDAKESLLFAVLANEAIVGKPSSLPQVTGASKRTILGKIVPR